MDSLGELFFFDVFTTEHGVSGGGHCFFTRTHPSSLKARTFHRMRRAVCPLHCAAAKEKAGVRCRGTQASAPPAVLPVPAGLRFPGAVSLQSSVQQGAALSLVPGLGGPGGVAAALMDRCLGLEESPACFHAGNILT